MLNSLTRMPGRIVIACLLAGTLPYAESATRGASPYLPLNISPEIERQIERVMILADRPVMSRPIPVAAVLDALPSACSIDAALCQSVRRYIMRYADQVGLDHASAEIAETDGAIVALPNQHGMNSDSQWQASVLGHWQPHEYIVVSVGGVGNADEVRPTGSMVSLGFDCAQLDIGYRDHWFSPFTHSAMIISTQAPTLPSITLSNYRPLTALGLRYEVFLAEMENSDRIRFDEPEGEDDFTSGKPRLAGLRFAIQPVPGWSLGANRMMQFGGGARGGRGLGDFIDALTKPHQNDNRSDSLSQNEEFGNQVAAWTSRFIFPGTTPFSAYMEYAGEDNSYEGNYRLGNAALSVGVNFPRLWRRFDLTYEVSEWQNAWYAHGIYLDGLTDSGHVLGHWGADSRGTLDTGVMAQPDAVGAQAQMLRIGWEPPFGGLMQVRARTIKNESYSPIDYDRGYDVSLSYSRTLRGFTAGGEVLAGSDVYGESYSRLSGFVRFGDQWDGGSGVWDETAARRPPGANLFVDAGANYSRVTVRRGTASIPKFETSAELAPHFAIGARRTVSSRSDLGVRMEVDRINDEMLLAVRALDYRYRFNNPLALSAFVGAARYDLVTPAYGYYLGAGVQWRNVIDGFDVGVDWRYADKVARDKLLSSDPPSDLRPDEFYDIEGFTLSVSYRW